MNEKEIYENWSETPNEFRDDLIKFHDWFDKTDSIRSTISQGHIDFHTKILTSEVYGIIGDVREKNCLEIGFGGGRLLNAASSIFENVTGVDIHSCFDITEKFLKTQGVTNFSLFHYDNIEKIQNNHIDFIFSFIVFQHFNSIKTFSDYIDFIHRVLKNDGCCKIYFGINQWNTEDFYLKNDIERKTNCSTLFYNPNFVKNELIKKGFDIISMGQTRKTPWSSMMSGQFYVTFRKHQLCFEKNEKIV